MKIDRLVREPEANAAFRARLLMLCFFFLLGGAVGAAVHEAVATPDAEQLRDYMVQYGGLSAAAEPAAATLAVVSVYLRYPLLVYLAGFLPVGLLCVPFLCTVQGFTLAFSVCCFSAALGRDGILMALAAFGIRCLFTLPCTMYLAAQAMERSFRKTAAGCNTGKRQIPQNSGHGPTLLCLMILALGIAAELTVVPRLIQLALANI